MMQVYPHISLERLTQLLTDKMGLVDCALRKVSDPGSSQSRVYIFETDEGKLIAVKTMSNDMPQRVWLSDEASNRDHITPYVSDNVAEIYWNGTIDNHSVMIYECIGTGTLHHEILSGNMPTSEVVAIWNDVLDKVTDMWTKTRTPTTDSTVFPRDYTTRYQRITDVLPALQPMGLDKSLEAYLDLPMIVNGVSYPSLRSTLESLATYDQPDVTVICHGDPQPSNIVVDPHSSHWQLIDWEWSAPGHDWRMMAAHLYGWWLTRTVSFHEKPTISADSGALRVAYQTLPGSQNDLYREMALQMLDEKMGLLSNPADMKSFKHFLVLLLLGEARFTPIWHREAHIPYLLAMATELMYSDFPVKELQK